MTDIKMENNPTSFQSYSLLGIPFHEVSLDDVVGHIKHCVQHKQKCFLTTPNLNFLVQAQRDRQFFQTILDSDLCIADGMPIVWLAGLLELPIKTRVAGSDVFEALMNTPPGDRIIRTFFFGGQPGVAEKATKALNEKHGLLHGCGFYDPGFGSVEEMSSDAIIQLINDARPDFVVVALGASKGQKWISHNKERLSCQVISHLGAVVNFVAGDIQRAPVAFQKVGLEWLWRIFKEPVLWKRYGQDGLAALRLLISKVLPMKMALKRILASPSDPEFTVCHHDGWTEIHFSGNFHGVDPDNYIATIRQELTTGQPVRLNISHVTFFGGRLISELQQLAVEARRQQQNLTFQCHNSTARKLISHHCVDYLLL